MRPRDPVTRGAVTLRTGGCLPPRASPHAGPGLAGRLAPGPRSRAGWLQRLRAQRAGFAPARARALCAGWPARTRPSGLRGGAKSSSTGETGVDPLALRPPASAAIHSPPPGRRGKQGKERWGRWGRGGVRLRESWGRSATAAALEEEEETQRSSFPLLRPRSVPDAEPELGGRGDCGGLG